MLSEDAVQISVDDAVHISGWGGDRSLTGRVRLVEPSAFTKISTLGVEEQRVNVVIEPNDVPADLGVGFRVEVVIVIWESSSAMSIPSSAAFQQNGSWYTFVVRDETAVRQAIVVGNRSSERVEIISGVSPGEQVIIFPGQDIVDGVRVEATN